MSWFSKPTAIAEPGPIVAVDRVEALRLEMAAALISLKRLNDERRSFKMQHEIIEDKLGQIVECRGKSITARAEIDREWAVFQRRGGRALHVFSEAEKVWSEAVMAAREAGRA
jgi:hypothetical protein